MQALSEPTVVLLIGLLFNFVTMVLGGLALLWSVGRWFAAWGERIAAIEANLGHLMRAQSFQRAEDRSYGDVPR